MNIDLHAHVLPAADHGSDGLETSLRQLSLAADAGIDVLAATPHFYPSREAAEDFLKRRRRAFERLAETWPGEKAPKLVPGAEVRLCEGLHHLPELEACCFAGTRVLLLELPPSFSLRKYEATLDALLFERKLTVVLAHIDRYAAKDIEELLAAGCLAQLNATAFCHFRTRKCALRWAVRDAVVALGSDLHGAATGYREFLGAKKRLGADYAALMQRTQTLLGL